MTALIYIQPYDNKHIFFVKHDVIFCNLQHSWTFNVLKVVRQTCSRCDAKYYMDFVGSLVKGREF